VKIIKYPLGNNNSILSWIVGARLSVALKWESHRPLQPLDVPDGDGYSQSKGEINLELSFENIV